MTTAQQHLDRATEYALETYACGEGFQVVLHCFYDYLSQFADTEQLVYNEDLRGDLTDALRTSSADFLRVVRDIHLHTVPILQP